jgi:hypothetical protein
VDSLEKAFTDEERLKDMQAILFKVHVLLSLAEMGQGAWAEKKP